MNGARGKYIGAVAGVASGAAYGLNPLFAKPLMAHGVTVSSMLLVRYFLAMVIIAAAVLARQRHSGSLKVRLDQLPMLIALGAAFTLSSIFLFEAYKFIPSGMAATLVYLYPIFTAITMVFYKELPSASTVVAIVAAFCGVALMCLPGGLSEVPDWRGLVLSALSALAYALYLVGVDKSKKISTIGVQVLTVYALATGSLMLIAMHIFEDGGSVLQGVREPMDWVCLLGLAIFPTVIAMVGLSVATRHLGATKAAILGVFEPITCIVIGLLVFHEPFTLTSGIGMTVCLLAMSFGTLRR